MIDRLIYLWRHRGERGTRFWSFVIAVGMSVVMLGIYYGLDPAILRRAEFELYDQHFRLRGPRAVTGVVVVAIDDKSLGEVGQWPWPRSIMGDLVKRLRAAGAMAVALDVLYTEPSQTGEQRAIRTLRETLAPHVDARGRAELDRAVRRTDHDAHFAAALRASERVVLGTLFAIDTRPRTEAPEREGQPLKSHFTAFANEEFRGAAAPVTATDALTPIPPLREAATGIGHVNMLPEIDGISRYESLVLELRGYYYTSLALEAVRVARDVPPFGMKLAFNSAIQLGDVTIPTDYRSRLLIDYAGPATTIPRYSAADVLAGTVAVDAVKDKLVFVGATSEGLYDLRATPVAAAMPGVEKHAHVAANLLERRFLVRPAWVELAERSTMFVVPLVLGLLLPRLRPLASVAGTVALGVLLFGAAHLAFRQGIWLPVVYPLLALGLTFTEITVYRFLTEERQRLFTKKAFQQYVSPEVVERIVEDPDAFKFGGEVRNLTILFSDIRDFTTYAERHAPSEVVSRLREHLTHLTRCVFEERGTLDKYIGDAVMAIFGAPIAMEDHAVRACRAALRMVEAADALNLKNVGDGHDPLRIGVGINSGDMVVGNLGSEQVFSYTVTGDAVNLGSRVESLNKDYPTEKPIIITEFTYELARHAIDARPLGEVKVKGKTRPVQIYELLGMKDGVATNK